MCTQNNVIYRKAAQDVARAQWQPVENELLIILTNKEIEY